MFENYSTIKPSNENLAYLKLTRMRVLHRKAEPILAGSLPGRKSNDQRMPSGDATAP
jgi:hypothetical protein